MTTWIRSQSTGSALAAGNTVLATIPAGKTLLRVHAGVVVRNRVPTEEDPNPAAQWGVGFGLYTNLAVGGTIQHPLTNPSDFAPPAQRWLHWRVLYIAPYPVGMSSAGSYWLWASAPGPDEIDVEAQVKTPGAALNLNASWEPTTGIKTGWAVSISFWASVLTS